MWTCKMAHSILLLNRPVKILTHAHTCNIQGCRAPFVPSFKSLLLEAFCSQPAGNLQKHNALNIMGYKGDGLKIPSNSLAMTEAVTITGSLRYLMPNGPLRVRLTGQLPTETQWTLCQFTIILAFVMWHSTDTPLFTDLWIIQLEQNAMTHFWSKSYYQGEEAFSRRRVLLSIEDKSSSPQRDLRLTVRIKPENPLEI